MANHAVAGWPAKAPKEAVSLWLDFELGRVCPGIHRVEFSEDEDYWSVDLKLKGSVQSGSSGWDPGQGAASFFLNRSGKLETRHQMGPHGWFKNYLFCSLAGAFGAGYINDEGVGRYIFDSPRPPGDISAVAANLGLTGMHWSLGSEADLSEGDALKAEGKLKGLYGEAALAALGYDRELMRKRQPSRPWSGSVGFAAFIQGKSAEKMSPKMADALLMPFCAYPGDLPPEWLIKKASGPGLKRAMQAALRSGASLAADALLSRAADQEWFKGAEAVSKAIAPLRAGLQAQPSDIALVKEREQRARALWEALALRASMSGRQEMPKSASPSI